MAKTVNKYYQMAVRMLGNAFKYNLIRGAVIVKIISAILEVSGHTPWSPEQNHAVEAGVDFLVTLLVLIGVGQAHETVPSPRDIIKSIGI